MRLSSFTAVLEYDLGVLDELSGGSLRFEEDEGGTMGRREDGSSAKLTSTLAWLFSRMSRNEKSRGDHIQVDRVITRRRKAYFLHRLR